MKYNRDWTPKDREQALYFYELHTLDDDPPYVPPPLPKLYTVAIDNGKKKAEPETGLMLWDFLETREGGWAAQSEGNTSVYYFDDENLAFEFKMLFG